MANAFTQVGANTWAVNGSRQPNGQPVTWTKRPDGTWTVSGLALSPTANSAVGGSAPGMVVQAPDGSPQFFTGGQTTQPVTKQANGDFTNASGQVVAHDGGWGAITKDFILPAAAGLTIGALTAPVLNSAFDGGAAAAGAGTGAATGGGAATGAGMTAVDSAATIPAGGGFVGANVGADAGAAATGSSILNNPWVQYGLNAATRLGGTLIANHAISSAKQQQQQATAGAEALDAQIYNQNRSALQPFIAGGTGAFNTLASLYGIAPTAPLPYVTVGQAPGGESISNITGGSLATPGTLLKNPAGGPTTPVPGANYGTLASPTLTGLSSPAASGAVRMQAPDGTVALVGPSDVAKAQAMGAQVIS